MMKTPNLLDKERQMLQLLANGASTRVIAKKMSYSEGTVRVYLHNLYKKINVKNRTQALLWQLQHGRMGEAQRPAAGSNSPPRRAEEGFGDVALRDGLLCTLGIMESFMGPYGRVWEVGVRLKGAEVDHAMSAVRDEARTLWRTLLQGSFTYGKTLHDEGFAERWAESSPSEAVMLACLLLLGGFSHAGDGCIAQLSKPKKGGRTISSRELSLLRFLREAIYSNDDEALVAIQQLALEKAANPVFRQLAVVALFHAYRHRKDMARARDTANFIWCEAENSRRQLEAMGVRPLAREATLPRPDKALARASREKVAAGS